MNSEVGGGDDHVAADAGIAVRQSGVFPAYLKWGIAGTVMRGGGRGADLDALPMPLGSTVTLFIPPTLAGPGGIPAIGISCPGFARHSCSPAWQGVWPGRLRIARRLLND